MIEKSWFNDIPKEKVIEWRRHIHQNPELSFKEFRTAQYVYDILESFDCYKLDRLTETSVLATLEGTAGPGKTILLRADIDALPVPEETGLPFASVNDGVSHACGHDTHTAMLLGTAAVLAKHRDKIAGTVKLIFQHAEELAPGGAQELVDKGICDDVDEVYGLHIIPNLKCGQINVCFDDQVTTSADGFFLTIKGRGSHGSMPEKSIDPIVIGAELIMALQTVVSRNVSPNDFAVLSVGQFEAGKAPNVIADSAKLSCSIRSIKPEIRELLEQRVKALIDHICTMNGAEYDLDYIKSYAPINNDKELAQYALEASKEVLGEELTNIMPRSTASEDFSAYAAVRPGTYVFLGGGLAEDGYEFMNHHPKFVIDEEALWSGIKFETQLVFDRLKA